MAQKAFKVRVKDEKKPVGQKAQGKASRRNNKHEGPRQEKTGAQSRNRKEVTVPGVGREKGKVIKTRLEAGYSGLGDFGKLVHLL